MYNLTRVSRNKKTGPIPTSMTAKATCPDACPFKKKGCYAEGGPVNIHWLKVSRGETGSGIEDFYKSIKTLPKGQIWRHNVAGDLPGKNNWIEKEKLQRLVAANKGKKGFTYSHKPVLVEDLKGPYSEGEKQTIVESNRKAIKEANENGFTINLSANGINHAQKLRALNIGPVVSVVTEDFETSKINDQKFVVCPATTEGSFVTCATCQLCQKGSRQAVVAFPAHGVSKKKVAEITKSY